jgi:hypothetical protein
MKAAAFMKRSSVLCFLFVLSALTRPPSADATPIYGLTTGNLLVRFDSATPGTIVQVLLASGLQSGELLQAIDFRPASGELRGGIPDGVHLDFDGAELSRRRQQYHQLDVVQAAQFHAGREQLLLKFRVSNPRTRGREGQREVLCRLLEGRPVRPVWHHKHHSSAEPAA